MPCREPFRVAASQPRACLRLRQEHAAIPCPTLSARHSCTVGQAFAVHRQTCSTGRRHGACDTTSSELALSRAVLKACVQTAPWKWCLFVRHCIGGTHHSTQLDASAHMQAFESRQAVQACSFDPACEALPDPAKDCTPFSSFLLASTLTILQSHHPRMPTPSGARAPSPRANMCEALTSSVTTGHCHDQGKHAVIHKVLPTCWGRRSS